MKKFIILSVFLCLVTPLIKAQSVSWNDPFPSKNSYGRNNLRLEDIDGSPYLDDQYVDGTITTPDGGLYKGIPLRYNCFNDVLEFKKDDKSYDIMPKDKVSRAEFGGQIFSYLPFEPGNGSAYFQILSEGKARLCAHYNINFYDREEAKGFADPKPARFQDLVETYWISVNKSPAKKILNKSQLMELLSDKKQEIQSFLSKQKINVKKADDLKKVINYYNTL